MRSLIVTIARVCVVILQLFYIKTYTNILPANELGQYAFWLTVSYFFNALLLVPIDNYIQTRLHDWKNSGVSLKGAIALNTKVLILCFSSAIIIATATLTFNNYLTSLAIFGALVYGLVLHVSNVLRNTTNNLNYTTLASAFLIVDGVLKIAALQIVSKITIVNGAVLILSATVSTLISSVLCFHLMVKKGVFYKGRRENVCIKNVYLFCYPISISAMLNWLQLQGYRLVLVPMGYGEAVGIYSTIASIGSAAMSSVGSIYSQLKMPTIYQTKGGSLIRYAKYAIILIAMMTFSLWLTSDLIVSLLTKSVLAEYSKVIVFGVLVEGGNVILGAILVAHSLNRPTKIYIAVGIIGFASSAFSFAVLIGKFNTYNIGYPLVISQLIAIIYLVYTVKKTGWMRT